MINFPEGLMAIKGYPGYFWDTKTNHLFSIKVGGVLRPLKIQKPFYTKQISIEVDHWSVSINGRQKILTVDKILRRLEDPHDIPIQGRLL